MWWNNFSIFGLKAAIASRGNCFIVQELTPRYLTRSWYLNMSMPSAHENKKLVKLPPPLSKLPHKGRQLTFTMCLIHFVSWPWSAWPKVKNQQRLCELSRNPFYFYLEAHDPVTVSHTPCPWPWPYTTLTVRIFRYQGAVIKIMLVCTGCVLWSIRNWLKRVAMLQIRVWWRGEW